MIFAKVARMISDKFKLDAGTLTMETKLKDDLNIDSLDSVELIMELEEAFGLSIKDEEAATLRTVGDIVNYIGAHAK